MRNNFSDVLVDGAGVELDRGFGHSLRHGSGCGKGKNREKYLFFERWFAEKIIKSKLFK